MRAAVVVASNRASTGVYEDTTGPLIVDALRAWGFEVSEPAVVGDGAPVADALEHVPVPGQDQHAAPGVLLGDGI